MFGVWSRLVPVAAAIGVAGVGCGDRLGDGGDRPDAGGTVLAPQPDAGASTGTTPLADAGGAAPSPGAVDAGQADAGAPPDAAWPMATTHRLTADAVEAVELASNGSAVFGMTARNGIWSLAAGDTAVRVIVPGGDTPAANDAWGNRLVATETDLYWLDRIGGALHRSRTDGSGDEVLAGGLDRPDTLAIDETRLYWSEVSYLGQGGGLVRSLPRDAAAGDPPATLVTVGTTSAISSLAASNGVLYWTSFISIGSTVYYAGLFAAAPDVLLQGGSGSPLPGNNSYRVTAADGAILYGYHRDLWTSGLAELASVSSSANVLSFLPINVGLVGVAVGNGWLIVSGSSSVGTEIYIAPRRGAGLVRIAQGLRTPAILGPAGITFIDESGALVYVELDDLGYIGFGHPAP